MRENLVELNKSLLNVRKELIERNETFNPSFSKEEVRDLHQLVKSLVAIEGSLRTSMQMQLTRRALNGFD